jgi:hypothetical protein
MRVARAAFVPSARGEGARRAGEGFPPPSPCNVHTDRGNQPSMSRLEKKHPLAIRWFHWINFPLLALMIWSGILIYWAYPTYRIGIGDFTLVKMNLDQTTWRALKVNNRLAEGMALHFFFMWLFVGQRRPVRRVHALLRRMARAPAEPAHAARCVERDAA